MNMNKALQNLYHAVSDETTTKVNISKLLVDIHYAITGKESENKNNWSKIVNSMADNWPEGGGGSVTVEALSVTQNGTYTAPSGKAYSPVTVNVSGGSSDFSTATVTLICNATNEVVFGLATIAEAMPPFVPQPESEALSKIYEGEELTLTALLYKGGCRLDVLNANSISGTGAVVVNVDHATITGDCTITIS